MLWIAVYLPQLPLDLAYRRWPEVLRTSLRHSMPLAVGEARRIGWANPCAQAYGIVPGMPESAAHTRHAELTVLAREPSSEVAAVIEAALWALHFTPQVALLPAGLLLDVSASLRLFGGLDSIVMQLGQGIAELGFTPQMASAPTATAAWMFACHSDTLAAPGITKAMAATADKVTTGTEVKTVIAASDTATATTETFITRVDHLQVAALASAQPHLDTLQAIGCHTIADIRRLPRPGITRRFGKAMLLELDRAFGVEPEIFDWYAPPEAFDVRCELAARLDTSEAILHEARRMLMQMTGWLVARHSAVREFSLLLHHEVLRYREKKCTTVTIALGSASRDLGHLCLLLQERLAQVDLSASVIELALQAGVVELLAAPNTELFPAPASQAESMLRLVERLASRLGDAAITRPAIVADHRPERCSTLLPPFTAGAKKNAAKNTPLDGNAFAARPAWLLQQPLALCIQNHKPLYQGPLALLAGPERIESGWWDDAAATRDYFIAANEGGLLLWIFRERLAIKEQQAEGWFLHGYFA